MGGDLGKTRVGREGERVKRRGPGKNEKGEEREGREKMGRGTWRRWGHSWAGSVYGIRLKGLFKLSGTGVCKVWADCCEGDDLYTTVATPSRQGYLIKTSWSWHWSISKSMRALDWKGLLGGTGLGGIGLGTGGVGERKSYLARRQARKMPLGEIWGKSKGETRGRLFSNAGSFNDLAGGRVRWQTWAGSGRNPGLALIPPDVKSEAMPCVRYLERKTRPNMKYES
ncbi:hypothetical protein DFP72DRAFT_1144017 [Ephemerocybe angulata]|uniref:Uncharacterized protein n=1 Tax=Ephemerocybe angulata TaxID=980116 RepID=A0A8H6HLG4_9AGAR|nr:hypothetical protein DFP72DRAFT_1144017 [Tulosesus angulatus]